MPTQALGHAHGRGLEQAATVLLLDEVDAVPVHLPRLPELRGDLARPPRLALDPPHLLRQVLLQLGRAAVAKIVSGRDLVKPTLVGGLCGVESLRQVLPPEGGERGRVLDPGLVPRLPEARTQRPEKDVAGGDEPLVRQERVGLTLPGDRPQHLPDPDDRPLANLPPEGVPRDVRDLVALVEDGDAVRWQELVLPGPLQHPEVHEQQAIVHDHDVGRVRPPARRHRMTPVLVVRARVAAAILRGDGEVLPLIARVEGQLRTIPGLGLTPPSPDLHEMRVPKPIRGGLEHVVELVEAEVVVHALEQRVAELPRQYLGQHWEVFPDDLLLERLVGRGDHHVRVGTHRGVPHLVKQEWRGRRPVDRRHRVGHGLAGAGASLGEEMDTVADRRVDLGGEVDLAAARLVDEAVRVGVAGEDAAEAEDGVEVQRRPR